MNTIVSKLKRLFTSLISLLFPSKCPICGTVIGSEIEGELCKDCFNSFTAEFTNVCPVCNSKPSDCRCVPKLVGSESDISPFTTVMPLIFAGYYTGYDEDSVISALVYKMKQSPSSGADHLFARMIAQAMSRELTLRKTDPKDYTVTFIPRSKVSLMKYGFDHMETVSKYVAEMLGCKYEQILQRKGGDVQKNLSAAERRANAYRSIEIDPEKKNTIRGAKFIVLDDVITTGSSMRVSISKLSFAGADTIIPAVALVSKTAKTK